MSAFPGIGRARTRVIASGRWALPLLVVTAVGLVAGGCGSDGPDAGAVDGTGDGAAVELSAAGQRGEDVYRTSGCAGCHGSSGEGAVGPPLVGLYGSDVELEDGTTVVADDAYLTRAITEPSAEVVADARVPMPKNALDDERGGRRGRLHPRPVGWPDDRRRRRCWGNGPDHERRTGGRDSRSGTDGGRQFDPVAHRTRFRHHASRPIPASSSWCSSATRTAPMCARRRWPT